MQEIEAENRYHIPKEPTLPVEDRIRQTNGQELEKWANDSNCFEMDLCAKELTERKDSQEKIYGRDNKEKPMPNFKRRELPNHRSAARGLRPIYLIHARKSQQMPNTLRVAS